MFPFQIVFMTALFYLLSSSGQLYKPVELIAKLGPVSRGSSRYVPQAPNSVTFPSVCRRPLFSLFRQSSGTFNIRYKCYHIAEYLAVLSFDRYSLKN